ncbi:MAG: SMC-Scp complex subunit ScpB [Planctomycetes bacterium RBG_16_59_8]|nr:MAG: SMC-Scp complex subunit ScpB [Planctomycetes bacterium RBG_16_59_8]
MENLKSVVEALLFANGEPLSVGELKNVIEGAAPQEIQTAVDELRREYADGSRAMTIEEVAGGYQFLTKPEHNEKVALLRKIKGATRLSTAAVETLAIVAYRQPIKRADIESIRGVQSGPLLRALMDRGLVRITGREDVPGSPLLYGTTPKFLETFGLRSLNDLPKPEEMK